PDEQLRRPVDQPVAVTDSADSLAGAWAPRRMRSPIPVRLRFCLPFARLPPFLPCRAHIFEKPFFTAFPAEAAFPVAAKARSAIKQIGRVDPDRSRLDLCRHVQRQVNVLRPD